MLAKHRAGVTAHSRRPNACLLYVRQAGGNVAEVTLRPFNLSLVHILTPKCRKSSIERKLNDL